MTAQTPTPPLCEQDTTRGDKCSRRATWIAPATNRAERAAGIEEHYCTFHAHHYGIHRKRSARRVGEDS